MKIKIKNLYRNNDTNSGLLGVTKIVLNDTFAINYCYIVDNTKSTDKDINIAFSFQVDANNVPYISILSNNLKEEILKKSFEEYKKVMEI